MLSCLSIPLHVISSTTDTAYFCQPMSSPPTVEVPVVELETMVKALVMHSFGYPEKHAEVMTQVLMYAQLRHNSQVISGFGIYFILRVDFWALIALENSLY